MKNTLTDLNNHLFAQIERLGDESLTGENLKNELSRSKEMSSIAQAIVANASLQLKALQFQDDRLDQNGKLPPALENKS